MSIRYVKKRWTAPLYKDSTGTEEKIELLWGDRVRVIDSATSLWKVKARKLIGFMNPDHLGLKSYLELYFIDVGQGDGILIRTPDDRHIMIDGGWPRRCQPTDKNAADFVDWKFKKDYEKDKIVIDAMICSHNDQDHYGGLWDLLDTSQSDKLDCEEALIENFYHAGLSWWKNSSGNRTLGPSVSLPEGDMWTQLLEDRASVLSGLNGTPQLQGEWASFLRKVTEAKTSNGNPTPCLRLSSKVNYLPGFDDTNDVKIKILAPVEFDNNGNPAIRKYSGGNSKNTNGNSVLLKIEYNKVKILLTGDLNSKSQESLLQDYFNTLDIFKCDLIKACHHGSDDILLSFLEAIEPACTVISSGDSEGHDHPRPDIIAASGLTGFKSVKNNKILTPLVYSTEIARSVAIGKIYKMEKLDKTNNVIDQFTADELANFRVKYKTLMAGSRAPKTGSSKVKDKYVVSGTTYGLINVRTDGKTIMCAALNEKDFKWNVKTFESRF